MEVLFPFDGISVEWEELKRTLQGCEDSLMVASRLQSFIQVHEEEDTLFNSCIKHDPSDPPNKQQITFIMKGGNSTMDNHPIALGYLLFPALKMFKILRPHFSLLDLKKV